MKPEQHEMLLDSIRQWGEMQDRISAELDKQNQLAETLRAEFGISKKHFKKIAHSYWAGTEIMDRFDLQNQAGLFTLANYFRKIKK